MRRRNRIAIVAGVVFFIPAAAGADETIDERQLACVQQLVQAEARVNQLVNNKAFSDGELEDVNLYLDELDGACTTKKYNKAEEIVGKIDKMIAPMTEPQKKTGPQRRKKPQKKKNARN